MQTMLYLCPMKKKYLIQNLEDNGYWARGYRECKGLLFATKFDTESEAESAIYTITAKGTYTIIPVWIME